MRGRRRRIIISIALAGLTLGVLAALIATRYYPAYRSALAARDDLREAQALLRDARLDASVADLAAAEARLDDAERGFRRTRQTFDDPLLWVGQHLPILGDSLTATVHLTDISIEGVLVGRDALAMARTYQQVRDRGEGTLTERTEEIFEEIDPLVAAMQDRLGRIREKRDRVAGAALPPALENAVDELADDLAELDELVRTYDDLSALLPDFLGFHGPRTYLLLAQNNAELLPTGGLISVFGVITIEDGHIQEKYFEDAVSYGGRWFEQTSTYIEPPAPLKRYLLRDHSWNLAVSNWSPHFPTAAQDAERFYRLAGGRPVDGVIAINVHTIEELLGVTGPISIEPYGVTVTAENALDVIEAHTRTARGPETDRKAFVGVLAGELLSRLVRTPSEQWTSLVEAVERLRDQRQILFFSHNGELQNRSHRLGLDGALEQPDGDYFMLVDASVNSTKLNIVLEQRIDLSVRIDASGNADHQVTVSYHNDLTTWSHGRDPLLVEQLMLGGLYGGYVRLLTPESSQLRSVTLGGREAGPDELSIEQGKAVFGRFFALPNGQQTELALRYATPGVTQLEDGVVVYRLYLQKQSGTGAIPLSLHLVLPQSASLRSAELDGAAVESISHIDTDLLEDRQLIVRYELGP